MTPEAKLTSLKVIHTAIWVFFNVLTLYAVIADKIDIWVWLCLAAVAAEGIVLLVFNRFCPITLAARKYSSSDKANFDIYLPNWLAKYNKLIYTSIVGVVVVVLIYRLLS